MSLDYMTCLERLRAREGLRRKGLFLRNYTNSTLVSVSESWVKSSRDQLKNFMSINSPFQSIFHAYVDRLDRSPHKRPIPERSTMSLSTFKVGPNGRVKGLPETFNCFIPLAKVPIVDMCRQNGINYRLACQDYDLSRQPDYRSDSDDESAAEEAFNDIINNCANNLPKTRQKMKKYCQINGKKRKSLDHSVNSRNGLFKRARLGREEPILKANTSSKNVTKSAAKKEPKSKKKKNKDPIASPIFAEVMNGVNGLNGQQDDYDYYKTSSPVAYGSLNGKQSPYSTPPTKTGNKRNRSMKAKDRVAAKKPKALNPNKCVKFLGELYRECQVIDQYCKCENDCELDELSMAFDLLITSRTDEEMPRDLRCAIGEIIVTEDEDRSDPELCDLLPKEADVLTVAREDMLATNDVYVDDFLSKMTVVPPPTSLPNLTNVSNSVSSSAATTQPLMNGSPEVRPPLNGIDINSSNVT